MFILEFFVLPLTLTNHFIPSFAKHVHRSFFYFFFGSAYPYLRCWTSRQGWLRLPLESSNVAKKVVPLLLDRADRVGDRRFYHLEIRRLKDCHDFIITENMFRLRDQFRNIRCCSRRFYSFDPPLCRLYLPLLTV
jgi:hypothetical protein